MSMRFLHSVRAGMMASAVAAVLLVPAVLNAQSIVNPASAVFTPSPDHNANAADGSPLVSRYDLAFYLVGATQPFQVTSLGKPAPASDGQIHIALVGAGTRGTTITDSAGAVWTIRSDNEILRNGVSTGGAGFQLLYLNGTMYTEGLDHQWWRYTGSGWTFNSATDPGGSQLSSLPSPGVVYESRVSAVGPGGTATSAVSNTFMFSTACTYAATPLTPTIAGTASGGTVNVTAPAGCTWTARSNATWLTVSTGASGTSNGSVTYTALANTSTSSRTGTLTVAGLTISVTQTGAQCSYGLSPATQPAPTGGGTGTLAVTSATGCSWTAASNATWLRITAGGTGSGNGTVSLTADANTSSVSRAATITVGGQTASVTQAGVGCTFSATSTTTSVAVAGGNGTVSVTAPGGCSWTASSNAGWLTLSSTGGSGTGSVNFTATANAASAPRSATLSVAGQAFTITQPGVPCTFGVTPTTASVAGSGGTGAITVTSPAGCAWTAASDSAWLTVGAGGSGSASVTFSAAANTATTTRSATLTVAGQAIAVSQAGAACTFTVTPTSESFPAAGGTANADVTTTAGCTWTATSPATWLTISNGASGTGNGTVSMRAAANSNSSSRSAAVSVAGRSVMATQSGTTCSFTVSPTTLNVADTISTGTITLSTAAGCAWTAASNAGWLTVTSGLSGTGAATVTFRAGRNNQNKTRTGTLTIGGQTVTITQAAAGTPKKPKGVRVVT